MSYLSEKTALENLNAGLIVENEFVFNSRNNIFLMLELSMRDGNVSHQIRLVTDNCSIFRTRASSENSRQQ